MSSTWFYTITTLFGIICFLSLIIYRILKKQEYEIGNLIVQSLAASTIPTSVLLIMCAFDTSLIQRFDGLGIYLAINGLTVLVVILNSIVSSFKRNESLYKKNDKNYGEKNL